MKRRYVSLVCIALLTLALFSGCRTMSPERQAAVDAYNAQVERVTQQLEERTTAYKAAKALLSKDLTPANVQTRSGLETIMDEVKKDKVDIPDMAPGADAINAQAEELSKKDLTGQTTQLETATTAYENSCKEYILQDAPWVEQRAPGWGVYQNGQLNPDFNGLGTNDYGSWYVANGLVDFNYNGDIEFSGLTFTILGGKVI